MSERNAVDKASDPVASATALVGAIVMGLGGPEVFDTLGISEHLAITIAMAVAAVVSAARAWYLKGQDAAIRRVKDDRDHWKTMASRVMNPPDSGTVFAAPAPVEAPDTEGGNEGGS